MSSLFHFLSRRRHDRELAAEVEAHLEEKVADLVDAGIPEREAREQARREFGNAIRYREISSDVWGWVWLETLLQDVRYGARMLAKNPGFTAVAVITLALGIAVNTSIFSLISGWLLKKPAMTDPDRVVAVVSANPALAIDRGRVSAADFSDWRREARVFEDLAAVEPLRDFNLSGERSPERVPGMRVTANYFRVLGVPPLLGRTFLEGEDEPGRDRVLVLTYGLWQGRFGSDPNIIGKTVTVDGEKYLVIGVMPSSFRQVAFLARLWTPLVVPAHDPEPEAREHRSLVLIGRLRPGADLEQARVEMAALAHRAEQNDPASEKGWGTYVMTLQEYGIQEDQIRPALRLLMTAVVLVLLIACVNIANLLLARAAKREQEIAIRTALGAGRMRVIRQLLVESLLIALIGGSAGLVLANWGIRGLRSVLGFNDYVSAMCADITLDHRVLLFTCLVSMGAALVFGVVPAIRVSATDPQGTLRQGGRTGDLRRGWGRDLLVGGQIALAVVLVTGAGLIIKGIAESLGGDYGFDTRQVLTVAVSLTSARYREPARQIAFFQGVSEKLQAIPGVEAAGIANAVPFTAEQRTFNIQGRPDEPAAQRSKARYFAVSAGYFEAFRIPLIQGRGLRESDTAGAHRVAVVNRVFAERFFAGQSPIGSYVRIDHDAPGWSEVVGIVGNIKSSYDPMEEDAQVYEAYLQVPTEPEMWITLRASGDANRLAPALRSAVWSIDPDQPIGTVQTLSRMIDVQQGGNAVFEAMIAIFGVLALVLAAVGIYGVVSYAVAQRTHEIGIRIALGAHRAHVLRQVFGHGMLLALLGTTLGLGLAAPLPRVFEAMLQGYRVHGLWVFFSVPLLLLIVVLAAIYVPATRAARVDPIEALRYE